MKFITFASLLFLSLIYLSLQWGMMAAAQEEDKPKVNFPETDIFLFELDLAKQQNAISNGKNVTARQGYDNQPYFTRDSDTFVYSRSDDYQTDVYEYSLITGLSTRLTNSSATEFSPTPTADNAAISFVSDRNASLWLGQRATLNDPQWALASSDNREPIGYYAWNHATGDILYWSQYGFSVALVHQNTPSYHFVSGHAVPSTPHVIPGTNKFSFVHRQTNGQVWIKEFDPVTKAIRPLTPIIGSNANYAWAPDGSILMIENEMLYRWISDSDLGWQVIGNLKQFGVQGANRVAISPDAKKLAVVGLPIN